MLHIVPEITRVVGSEVANQVLHTTAEDGEDKVKSVLRSIFTQLMSANEEMISTATTTLKGRLLMESQIISN